MLAFSRRTVGISLVQITSPFAILKHTLSEESWLLRGTPSSTSLAARTSLLRFVTSACLVYIDVWCEMSYCPVRLTVSYNIQTAPYIVISFPYENIWLQDSVLNVPSFSPLFPPQSFSSSGFDIRFRVIQMRWNCCFLASDVMKPEQAATSGSAHGQFNGTSRCMSPTSCTPFLFSR